MKKLLYTLFLLSLSFGFAACGGDDDNDDKKEEEKPFTWKGDWNDTTDPQYPKFDITKYPNGYNPIVGKWIIIPEETVIMEYTEDFQILRSTIPYLTTTWETKVWAEKYMINDIGIRYERPMNPNTTREYRIVKENGVEILMWRYQPNPGEWSRYKRYYK